MSKLPLTWSNQARSLLHSRHRRLTPRAQCGTAYSPLGRDTAPALEPTYDIVQLLAVYQHVDRARGDLAARRMLATLAERCSETFIVASQPSYIPAIIEVLSAAQFRLERETTSPARRVKHVVFYRE